MAPIRVVVTGPPFHGYSQSVARGFGEKGCETYVVDGPPKRSISPLELMKRIVVFENSKIASSVTDEDVVPYAKKDITAFNERLLEVVSSWNPQLLVILKGDFVERITLERIAQTTGARTALWCYDSVSRMPSVLDYSNLMDSVFSYEPSDVVVFEERRVVARVLPMAYDPFWYHPIVKSGSVRDLCFVGYLSGNHDRVVALDYLMRRCPKIDAEFWDQAWGYRSPHLMYKFLIRWNNVGWRLVNQTLDHSDINAVYNASKICLNIHHKQSKQGVNPRTFEILGAGGFELVEKKSLLGRLSFDKGDLAMYDSLEEMGELVKYYLGKDEERQKISLSGHEKAAKHHTYSNRAETILLSTKPA